VYKFCHWSLLSLALLSFSCHSSAQNEFDQLNASSDWTMKMIDPCTANWQNNWFLDGKMANVENSEKGMNFIAGPVNRNDAHHAVLWTKESFKGDVKLEYNYTRTDSQVINVNILYIQATGIGTEPYDKDISKWNKLREITKMSIYYNYMNPIHISYSAFPMVNDDPDNDYIRVRKYPVSDSVEFSEMEVSPSYFKTGLFLPNVSYKITVIKTDSVLMMQVENDQVKKLYQWDMSGKEAIHEGRIGLRHMYTRSARYSDFKVSVK
jgi:hypothetical protein